MLKEKRHQRVTAKDIANQLGLSQPTVSRILNETKGYRVSEETRRRVLSTAAEMGYRPNALARSLRSQRTNALGLYTGYGYVDARNAFLAAVIGGVQRAADGYEMDLLLYGTFRGTSTEDIFGKMMDGRIDGLLVHTHAEDPLVARLRESRLPTVAIADTIPGIPSVVCDDGDGIRQLVGYLREQGHERIGFVRPKQRFTSVEIRAEAFREALQVYCPNSDIRVLTIDLEEAAPVLETLKTMPDPPTALCCWNDLTALRLLDACRKCGVRVPEDLAVTGFDGLMDVWTVGRSLITVGAHWNEITTRAVELLVRWINDGSPATIPDVVRMPVNLIAGDTA
ncbi:MAG: LacI family DNA-binding transcriptional regulator [Armatimonadaceae bacterium]